MLLTRPDIQKGDTVMVAMSGGVDSSVAALCLQEAGLKPVGVTLRLWVDPLSEERASDEAKGCCSLEAVTDAGKVAAKLGIPHYVFNMKEEFYNSVVQNFISEYLSGRTPNPCIECNRVLKFSLLLDKAKSLGFKYLASGHYARLVYDKEGQLFRLFKGRDSEKDQSYMLYVLGQEHLSSLIFPLGEKTKNEVREIADNYGLSVARKAESQEICFIPDNDYRGFLEREHPGAYTEGKIVSTDGKIIGKHRGVAFYTVGQRKGLGLTAPRPLYVVKIDPSRNQLVVGEEEEVHSKGLLVEKVNFVSEKPPEGETEIEVKIRYRSPAVAATLFISSTGEVKVHFKEEQKAVTPGQSAVFYKEGEVVGGGVISRAF